MKRFLLTALLIAGLVAPAHADESFNLYWPYIKQNCLQVPVLSNRVTVVSSNVTTVSNITIVQASGLVFISNEVSVLETKTNGWTLGSTAGIWSSNWIAPRMVTIDAITSQWSVVQQLSSLALTGTPSIVEGTSNYTQRIDAHNFQIGVRTNFAVTEVDPIWSAASNLYAQTNWVDLFYYPRSNPSNYVDRTVTNGLGGGSSMTETDPVFSAWQATATFVTNGAINLSSTTNWVTNLFLMTSNGAVAAANSHADGLAGNYATAAQGAKADTSVSTTMLHIVGPGECQGWYSNAVIEGTSGFLRSDHAWFLWYVGVIEELEYGWAISTPHDVSENVYWNQNTPSTNPIGNYIGSLPWSPVNVSGYTPYDLQALGFTRGGLTNGFGSGAATVSISNGTVYIDAHMPSTNGFGTVVTNNSVDFYPINNPSNYVDRTVTNGLGGSGGGTITNVSVSGGLLTVTGQTGPAVVVTLTTQAVQSAVAPLLTSGTPFWWLGSTNDTYGVLPLPVYQMGAWTSGAGSSASISVASNDQWTVAMISTQTFQQLPSGVFVVDANVAVAGGVTVSLYPALYAFEVSTSNLTLIAGGDSSTAQAVPTVKTDLRWEQPMNDYLTNKDFKVVTVLQSSMILLTPSYTLYREGGDHSHTAIGTLAGSGAGISDAPDTKLYARTSGAWSNLSGVFATPVQVATASNGAVTTATNWTLAQGYLTGLSGPNYFLVGNTNVQSFTAGAYVGQKVNWSNYLVQTDTDGAWNAAKSSYSPASTGLWVFGMWVSCRNLPSAATGDIFPAIVTVNGAVTNWYTCEETVSGPSGYGIFRIVIPINIPVTNMLVYTTVAANSVSFLLTAFPAQTMTYHSYCWFWGYRVK